MAKEKLTTVISVTLSWALLLGRPNLHHRRHWNTPRSGGRFIDMSIHDIDLIRWLTGSEPKKLGPSGCFEFKQYADWDDGDNASRLMQCENDWAAFFMLVALQPTVLMSKPKSLVPWYPPHFSGADRFLVEVMSEHGACRECYQDFVTLARCYYY